MAKGDRTGNRKTREQRRTIKVPELGYYLIVTDTEGTERCFFAGLHQSLSEEVMIIFKVKTGRGGVKGYLKGVGIYGVPVLMFTFLRLEILRFGYLVDIFLRTKSVGAVITLHFLWDFADFMNHMMIVERYRYGGSYNALALQIPVLIVMLVIAVFCMYKRQMRLQSV